MCCGTLVVDGLSMVVSMMVVCPGVELLSRVEMIKLDRKNGVEDTKFDYGNINQWEAREHKFLDDTILYLKNENFKMAEINDIM